jgi:hypothetical protein
VFTFELGDEIKWGQVIDTSWIHFVHIVLGIFALCKLQIIRIATNQGILYKRNREMKREMERERKEKEK